MNAGRAISNAREAKGMTAKELADAIGVNTHYIHHLENYVRNLPPKTANVIASILDIPKSELVRSAAEEEATPRTPRHSACFEYEDSVMMLVRSDAGQKIKDARLSINMRQSTLASRIGITTPAISMIESGRRKPSIETAMKIASVLDISADDLMIGHRVPTP